MYANIPQNNLKVKPRNNQLFLFMNKNISLVLSKQQSQLLINYNYPMGIISIIRRLASFWKKGMPKFRTLINSPIYKLIRKQSNWSEWQR